MIIKKLKSLEDVNTVEITSNNSILNIETLNHDSSLILDLLVQLGFKCSLANEYTPRIENIEKAEFKVEGKNK